MGRTVGNVVIETTDTGITRESAIALIDRYDIAGARYRDCEGFEACREPSKQWAFARESLITFLTTPPGSRETIAPGTTFEIPEPRGASDG